MRQIATPGVQYKAIHLRGDQPCLLQCLFSRDVNDLHNMDPRQRYPELMVGAVREAISKLHSVDAAAPLLRDDRRHLLADGHEKGRDAWGNARRNVSDAGFGKGT